jgi:hypothetical protein
MQQGCGDLIRLFQRHPVSEGLSRQASFEQHRPGRGIEVEQACRCVASPDAQRLVFLETQIP